MTILEICNLYKSFDSGKTFVLRDINLSFDKGKVYALIGDSGSGKTTLLRLLSGLEPVDAGKIYIKDKLVSDESTLISPHERSIGMVFQDLALFPHLTVSKNISFGIVGDIRDNVSEMLHMIELSGYDNRYPHQLSIGQQQRVAIARALVTKPEILLLDEPFSNLDENLKTALRQKLQFIVKQLEITMVFITHDVRDAIALADEAMFLRNGKLLQKGNIHEIFQNPTSDYVRSVYENLTTSAEQLLTVLSKKT
ncbi:MAG: ATP-binding cassette domain-containing protein [Bacteroidetes bacterium]|jgi:iron(III) transport system ATP-binding protein|nr:ATP-binding cassette domain-containing protein [Bacteroidota bacterium]